MNKARLLEILKTMDIPEWRLTFFDGDIDLWWFARNITIRNSSHPDIKEALDLIKEGIKEYNILNKESKV